MAPTPNMPTYIEGDLLGGFGGSSQHGGTAWEAPPERTWPSGHEDLQLGTNGTVCIGNNMGMNQPNHP